jgi:MoxR-like ATPase
MASSKPGETLLEINTGKTHPSILRLVENIERVIYGKRDVILQVLVAVLSRGHVLIEDIPGVGKTTLARALAQSIRCEFRRVQFTSDLLPSDVLGVSVYNSHSGEFTFRKGPIFTNILLADEINRTTPKTQSSLLEAMNRGKITMDGKTYDLEKPFMVVATQNPVEMHGTYPLPDSQMDRFLLRIRMGYPSEDEEKRILRDSLSTDSVESLEPVVDGSDILEMANRVSQVFMEESVLEYLSAIIRKTRAHSQIVQGASPRAALGLSHSAKALAFIENRSFCTPDDVKRLAVPTLAHRLVLRSRSNLPGDGKSFQEEIVQEILAETSVPA